MADPRELSTYFSGWTSTETLAEVNTSSFTVGEQPALVPPTSSGIDVLSREIINKELKWLFVLHTYGFACLFFVLAFYTFFSILNLRSLTSSRSCMTTINVFVCLLGVVRSSCLFIDPYHLRKTLPRSLSTVLWDLGYPSVMAAFCFVQLAFLQLTQVHVGPASMRKKSFLSLIITGHLGCVLGSDVLAAFQDQLMIVKYVVQTAFLVWGIFLCCTFLYAGYKVMALLKLMPEEALLGAQSGCTNKGIMQLAMIAPYTNLASCLTAALMPTLLGPTARPREAEGDPRQLGASTPPTASLEPSARVPGQKWSPGSRRKDRSASASGPATSRRRSSASTSSASARSRRASEFSVDRRTSNVASNSLKLGGDLLPSAGSDSTVPSPRDEALPPRSPRLLKTVPSWGRGEGRSELKCTNAQLSDPVTGNKVQNKVQLETCKSSDASKEINHSDLGGAKKVGKNAASTDEEAKIELLPQRQPRITDVTLDSILNHIAYVNRTSGQRQVSMESTECKSQVRRVLRVTYATALLGLLLCLTELCHLYVPLDILASPSVWPWFCVLSVGRAVEFAMGCAMANITKQPANTRYNQRPFGHPGVRREPHYL